MRKILLSALFIFLAASLFAQSARKEFEMRNYQSAIDICKEEINNKTATADTYSILVRSLCKVKKNHEAINTGTKAFKLFKEVRFREHIGIAYYNLGEYAKAMDCFKEYKRELPDGYFKDDVCYYMGEIYLKNGEYNNADISLSEAVSYYERQASWWSSLGEAREKAGYKELAITAYEKALALNKNNAKANDGLKRVKGE